MANAMSILRLSPKAPNGNAKAVEQPEVKTAEKPKTNGIAVNGHSEPQGPKYEVTDAPMGVIKPVRLIAIGAGASGINMAYQTKHFLKEVELVVYEKNPDIGGTWFENRYPGCKCDIRE